MFHEMGVRVNMALYMFCSNIIDLNIDRTLWKGGVPDGVRQKKVCQTGFLRKRECWDAICLFCQFYTWKWHIFQKEMCQPPASVNKRNHLDLCFSPLTYKRSTVCEHPFIEWFENQIKVTEDLEKVGNNINSSFCNL